MLTAIPVRWLEDNGWRVKMNLSASGKVLPASYVFSVMVGMARCAVPARVVAGGTNIRATLVFEEIAPLHAARTSQRDVPTTLNRSTAATLGVPISCSGVGAVRALFPRWSAGGRE